MVAHGTDVRHPDRHGDLEPDSPFRALDAEVVTLRQRHADRVAELMTDHDWAFVSTPDLLLDVPAAQWLPVVVDSGALAGPAVGAARHRPAAARRARALAPAGQGAPS